VLIAASVSSEPSSSSARCFLASCVETVEALTIVFAVGHTRGGVQPSRARRALVVLTALVAAFGPALVHVPLSALRLVVGGVLLIFGMQWLRKSILRATPESEARRGRHL